MVHSLEILGYEVLATLGYGARSTIFAVKDREQQIYALKRVVKESESDQRYLDQAILEHDVARRFNHQACRKSIKLIRQRQFIRTSEIIVLMEMVDGLTMEAYTPRDLLELCRLMQQVTKGLAHIHETGYVHADIKPNNLLVTNRQVLKIIDFGQSCPIGTAKPRIQGTPDYIAPEQVHRRPIVPQTDVFNLGATMYWLLTRQHVPTMIPKGQPGVMARQDSGVKTPRDFDPEIPPALSTLVMSCVETDPLARPSSMTEVHDRLELAIAQLTRQKQPTHPASQPTPPDTTTA